MVRKLVLSITRIRTLESETQSQPPAEDPQPPQAPLPDPRTSALGPAPRHWSPQTKSIQLNQVRRFVDRLLSTGDLGSESVPSPTLSPRFVPSHEQSEASADRIDWPS